MKTITVAQLRVGNRFTWIPKQWYGSCKLISKERRQVQCWYTHKVITYYVYDMKFDAAVVNPPGVEYGVKSTTKVRLLKKRGERG